MEKGKVELEAFWKTKKCPENIQWQSEYYQVSLREENKPKTNKLRKVELRVGR